MSVLNVIWPIPYFLHVMWVVSSFLLDITRRNGFRRSRFTIWTRRELTPFRWWLAGGWWVLMYFDDPGYAITFHPLFGLAMGLFCCWAYAHDEDDDDRWKKRRQRLAAKVAVLGGRLQVVPVRA